MLIPGKIKKNISKCHLLKEFTQSAKSYPTQALYNIAQHSKFGRSGINIFIKFL